MAAYGRALERVLHAVFEVLGTLPTSVAAVLTPLFGISVRIDSGPRPSKDFDRRIADITRRLQQSGQDAQALLAELEELMAARRQQLFDAQATLLQLQLEESAVQERVDHLKSIQPEAAVAIGGVLNESLTERERRGERRDWLIFGLGVVATAVVSLVFFLVSK